MAPSRRVWALPLLLTGALPLVGWLSSCLEPAFLVPRAQRQASQGAPRNQVSMPLRPTQAQSAATRLFAMDYAAAAEAASASLPAIGAVIAVAATGSAIQLSRALGSESRLLAQDNFYGPRWVGQTVAVVLVWLLFVGYAFLLAPGKGPEAQAADQALLGHILSTPFDGVVAPLFVCIFNMLGIWPVIYAATLLPGSPRQPVPAGLFVGGSFALGAFALAPYIAIREYRGEKGSVGANELDWVTANVFESRWNAILMLGGAVYLALFALGNGTIGNFVPAEAWATFLPVFMGSLTPHVSCIDFMVLWMLYAPVLLEDGRRRGCFEGPPSSWSTADTARFIFGAGVPVFGGVSWLLTRPPLPEQGRN